MNDLDCEGRECGLDVRDEMKMRSVELSLQVKRTRMCNLIG
jgi:hypothetical protein